MSTARYIIGAAAERLAELEEDSVDLVLTSPPFLALRSYLPADHPDKGKELGSEGTPGEFLDNLLDVIEACERVLAPHGSIVIELGDTYSGSGGAGGDYSEGGLRDGQPRFKSARKGSAAVYADKEHTRVDRAGWPLDKSLCCIPALLEVALAYGINPLTGRELERWRVRNYVAWCRPNPPVGELHDRFRAATSYLTVACKARNRWFDLDAVRTINNAERMEENVGFTSKRNAGRAEVGLSSSADQRKSADNPLGAPPLDWWLVATEPYPGSHYATWPRALLVRPVAAMCPERVCTVCGEPSRRIRRKTDDYAEHMKGKEGRELAPVGERLNRVTGTGAHDHNAEYETVGWTDCGHDTWRRGMVLDPFAGSGTTLAVATGHGRDAIGIDIDERNLELARQRIGMFLEVDERPDVVDLPAL